MRSLGTTKQLVICTTANAVSQLLLKLDNSLATIQPIKSFALPECLPEKILSDLIGSHKRLINCKLRAGDHLQKERTISVLRFFRGIEGPISTS